MLVHSCLHIRDVYRDCFLGQAASYTAHRATGACAEQVVAFGRGEHVIAVASRLPLRRSAAGGWRDTALALPDGVWTDELRVERQGETGHCETGHHGGTVLLDDLLGDRSVALLTRR